MKTMIIYFALILLVARCGSPQLDTAAVFKILQEQKDYPRTVDYDLYCADPTHARRVLDTRLEEKGLLTVKRTLKLGDAGASIISFTAAAKPYLLPTSEKEKAIQVQKIKMAEEIPEAVSAVSTADDGKHATVTYTTRYTNFTPFNVLRSAPKNNKTYTVSFVRTDKGWAVEGRK